MPPTVANLKYAERLAAEIQQRIKLGLFRMADYFPDDATTTAADTVVAAIEQWLGTLRVEESTEAAYRSALKFWRAAFPDKPLARLTHSDILKATAARRDLTGKTLNNYMTVLKQALDLAVTDGAIAKSPADGIPKFKHQKPPPDPFTREEAEQIIARLGQQHAGQVHNMVEFWFWTGLRTSELYGLDWCNVDLNTGYVQIKEAVVRGKAKDHTKTNTERTVYLNSRAMAALQRQRAHTQMQGGKVFQDPRYGTPWEDERAFRRSYWTPTLKVLGIRYRRPYNMRHSYATAMLMAGMTPAFCAKQLGHSVEVFLSTYAKWVDGDQNAREMARLESAIGPEVVPSARGAGPSV